MLKVGIITINDYNNYGNRLQNYATQEIIESLGCKAETVVSKPNINESIFNKIMKRTIKELIAALYNKIKKTLMKKTLKEKRIDKLLRVRKGYFINFSKKYIKETDYTISADSLPPHLVNEFDKFIVGSDQVWNPNFRGGSPVDFLTFAPKEKRIAFSASFGVSTLPDNVILKYKKWLNEITHISVREDVGAKLIKQLTNRDVQVLLDPTLLIEKDKWLEITRSAENKPIGSYFTAYFLGEMSKEKLLWIDDVVKCQSASIVRLNNANYEKYYSYDPAQFIDLINNCSMVFTDSYHGAAFSILFEKPFVVFERVSKTQAMNSRLDTLLAKFEFENRRWENIKGSHEIFEMDYSHVQPIMEKERIKAIMYLKRALGLENP